MNTAKEHLSKYSALYAGAGVGTLLFFLLWMITRKTGVTPGGIPKMAIPSDIPALQDIPKEIWEQLLEVVQLQNKP